LTQLRPGFGGRYQAENAAVALAAAEVLLADSIKITPSALIEGVAAAYWPGRMELVPGTPRLLLDGAHNPAGAAALAEALTEYEYARLLLVTGCCDDKNIEQIYGKLMPLVNAVYTVTPAVDRAMNDADLSQFFSRHGITSQPCGSVVAGVLKACSSAAAEDLVLVCGSLFVVGEVKAWLEHAEFTGIRG
jgi:dihydrofolate synthase/folylpolyglutamate synthase